MTERLFKCSKCKEQKPRSSFHADNRSGQRGVQRYCKECKKKKDRNGTDNDAGAFSVYMLPKEHYVGMTRNVTKRMQKHRKRGRDTEGNKVLFTTKKAKLAHIVESFYHLVGYNGFRY